MRWIVILFMLSGCAGYITEARQVNAAFDAGTDEAYDAIVDLGCNKTPIGTLAGAVERRGDDYAHARYLRRALQSERLWRRLIGGWGSRR